MSAKMTRLALLWLAVVLGSPPALAASHLWVIHEVFSNADGTIQFIELMECCGAPDETDLEGLWVRSNATDETFFFPEDLPPGSTANQHLLLATPGFAALPGAPTPDYIIQDSFFSTQADVLNYYFFPQATLQFVAGQLPLDGVSSFHQDGTVAVNSPTNFAGDTGSVVVGCEFIRGDANFDGGVGLVDAVYILSFLFSDGPSPVPAAAGDVNDDDETNLVDGVYLLGHLFSNGPEPPAPFPDPGCE